jgi:hypothetical protein
MRSNRQPFSRNWIAIALFPSDTHTSPPRETLKPLRLERRRINDVFNERTPDTLFSTAPQRRLMFCDRPSSHLTAEFGFLRF